MKLRFLSLYLSIGFLTFATMVFVSPFKAFAVSSSSILVDVAPENPSPNEDVGITLSSYGSNLNSVLISWFVNGKNVLSGIGKKTFSLKAPNAGSETTVTVAIALPDGVIEKKIIIRPSVMILLWQANDSYVPPFYRGKALPTPDSEVKIVAMPEVKNGTGIVNPKNMVYAWKKDYNNAQNDSGYGKNFFTYVNDYLDDSNNISVVASTTDQKYSSEASIDINTYQPKIEFYKNDASLGTLWEQALTDGHQITGNEVIEAAPYFISPGEIRIPTLTWSWSINGNPIDILGIRKNLIPLAVQAGTSGTSKIRLEINNTEKIFETANKEINVNF